MKIIFASNNLHKQNELRNMLTPNLLIQTLEEAGLKDEIEETGLNLTENAFIKAKYVYEKTNYHIDHLHNHKHQPTKFLFSANSLTVSCLIYDKRY